jgi:adenosylmethionine-8-amino-7-oxononanoate aminotransferase
MRRHFIAQGVFIRPIGKVIYLAPAYTILPDELGVLTSAIVDVLAG